MTDNLFQAQAEQDQRQWAELNKERQWRYEEALIECLMRGVSEKAMDALFLECKVPLKEQISLIEAAQKRVKDMSANTFYEFVKHGEGRN